MKNIKKLITGFLNRAGSWIFLATIIARISNFLIHLLVLYFIPKNQLGMVIYAYSFIAFLIPISGLGVQQSLVRYGARLKSESKKKQLFQYVLRKGIVLNFLFILFLLPLAYWYPFKFNQARFYFLLLSLSLLSHYLHGLIKIYFRLFYQNKIYAKSEIFHAVLFLVLTIILTYFFKEIGYIIAIISAPFLTFLYYFLNHIKLDWKYIKKPKIINIEFWKYGVFAGLANVATLLLFEIDIILIGNLLENPDKITIYKYISLIPMSLLFLPRVLMTADFVYLTENITDRNYISNYIKTYIILFSSISVILIILSALFGNILLTSLFGKEFSQYIMVFIILIIGVSGIFILRGLFGNLLSAIGKANLNFVIALIAITINIISNRYFIPKYGILGASITSAIIMWFTGILSCLFFYIYYKKMQV